ncbi:MAG: hypothetical protein ABGX27_07370 [Desulfurobacteriaceae bacterium]
MGFLLFLILVAVIIFVVLPALKSNNLSKNFNSRNVVEIKGLDGSVLNFSDDGVSYFKDGNFTFFRASEIKRFSFEKLEEDIYEIKIDNGREIIRVPVRKEEIQKLFKRTQSGYDPSFPWLSTILGTAVGFLIADLIADTVHEAFASQEEKSEEETKESIETENEKITDYDDGDYEDFGDFGDF